MKMAVFMRLIALMMEAARTCETLVNFYQTTRRYNPEDSNLHVHIVYLTTLRNKIKFDGQLLVQTQMPNFIQIYY
jgi:hypothetical protein